MMATIRIGKAEIAVGRSAETDARLLAATGCTAAEHAAMLGPRAAPGQLARALAPLIEGEAPSPAELGEMIADADMEFVRGQVIALLTASPAAAPAAQLED